MSEQLQRTQVAFSDEKTAHVEANRLLNIDYWISHTGGTRQSTIEGIFSDSRVSGEAKDAYKTSEICYTSQLLTTSNAEVVRKLRKLVDASIFKMI